MLCKKSFLKKFANFKVKHLCQNLFFNKIAGLRPVTLSKKRLWSRYYFLVNSENFSRTPFYRLPSVAGSQWSYLVLILRPWEESIRYYSFSTFAKFSKKLTFVTPWYTYLCVSGDQNFFEKFRKRTIWMIPYQDQPVKKGGARRGKLFSTGYLK